MTIGRNGMQESLNSGTRSPWARRKLRLQWLADNYVELGLANYPWGLSRTIPKERVERYNRELAIFRKMQRAKLLSEKTNFLDVNFNNLIVDARKLYYQMSKEN